MRPPMKAEWLRLLCAVAVWPIGYAAAQSASAVQPDALTKTLAHLAELAAAEKVDIPSFECTETGVSTVMHGDSIKKRVTFTATIQAKRNAKGSLDETFRVHMLDGQPYDKEKTNMPLYIEGGFSSALSAFEPKTQACMQYTLSPGRIDFAAKPDAEKIPGCHVGAGLQGFASLDADGNVTHMEHRLPKDIAYQHHMATFASVDFKPVELNGQIYRLTSNVIGELPSGGNLLRFEAMYSVCHRFASTVTIGPASELPPDAPGNSAPK